MTWGDISYTNFGRRFQVLRAVGQLTEKPELVVVQHVDTLMVGPQVVHLFFVHARPKVGAYEFQDFQLFLVPRQLLRYPVQQQKKVSRKRHAVNTEIRRLADLLTSRSDANRRNSPNVPISICPRPRPTHTHTHTGWTSSLIVHNTFDDIV